MYRSKGTLFPTEEERVNRRRALREGNERKRKRQAAKKKKKKTFQGNPPTVPLGLILSYNPHCFSTAKDCGAVKTPSNGSSIGNLTTYPHKVQFICDEGFNLRGSKTRQCLSTGNWSGNESFCEGTVQRKMSKMWQAF